MNKFSDRRFLEAVEFTQPRRGQVQEIARRVGCAEGTAIKRLRKLEEAGLVIINKRHTYDPQEHRDAWGASLFGGASSCIRRYLTIEINHGGG